MARPSGSILVVVLFVTTVLTLGAVGFAYRASLLTRTVQHRVIVTRLRAHAASAASIVLARLAEDANDFDHRAEPWHAHGFLASEGWLPEWEQDVSGRPPEYVTECSVVDEESKLHVLLASSSALEKLGMSPEQILSLLDWMDGDDDTRAEGAERGYYLNQQPPYRCKNAPLELLEELLLIRGFSLQDFLGEDANHNGILDPSEDDRGLSFPPDDADGRLRLGWVDLLTCLGDGRINLNTVPRAILETLPLSEGAVDQVLGYRFFDADSSGNLEDHVFRSEEDIDQLQGLEDSDRDVLKQVSRFRSDFFRIFIRSRHLPTGLAHRLEVLASRADGAPRILQWKVGP